MNIWKWIHRMNCVALIVLWLLVLRCPIFAKENDDNLDDLADLELDTMLTEYDFREIDLLLKKNVPQVESFSTLIKELASSKISLREFGKKIGTSIMGQILEQRASLLKIIALSLLGAMLPLLVPTKDNYEVARIGMMMIRAALAAVFAIIFFEGVAILNDSFQNLLQIYEALIPSYLSAMTVVTGSATSGMYYEVILMLITVIQYIMQGLFLKLIQLDFFFCLADAFCTQNSFGQMHQLIRWIIRNGCKIAIGLFTGIGCVKGLLVPAQNTMQKKMMLRVVKVIPGVGDAAESVAQTMFGMGVLLKNALGAGGIVILVIIGAAPLIRLFVITLLLRMLAAVLEPIAENRMIQMLVQTGKCCGMLITMLLTAYGLCMVLILITCVVTGIAG